VEKNVIKKGKEGESLFFRIAPKTRIVMQPEYVPSQEINTAIHERI
jgi:hypothetical protein